MTKLLFTALLGAPIYARHATNCAGLDAFPISVINTDSKPERLAYSSKMWGSNMTRMRGPNGMDPVEMGKIYDFPTDVGVFGDWSEAWQKKFGDCRPGESACLAGHVFALHQAYMSGVPHVLVMEDDIGDQLCPFWPVPLTQLVSEADKLDPEWELIRLQWHKLHPTQVQQMRSHIEEAKKHCTDSDEGAANTPHLVSCSAPLWGAGANIWSRRGMERALQRVHYSDSTPQITCPNNKAHVDQCLMSLTMGHCYESLPGFFAVRLVEEGSNIRGSNTKLKQHHWHLHQESTLLHLEWLLMLREVCMPLGMDNLPAEFNDIVIS